MNILWVALFTVKDILRSKILVGVFFIAIFIALFSFLASKFTFGVPIRVALDIGLGGISISNIAISIFFGVTLLAKEIESRTIYLSLVHPVGRGEFLLGKVLGLILVIAINTFLLSIIALSAFFILGGSSGPLLFWSIVFSFLEASLLLVIVIFFSMIANVTISTMGGISIYLIGQTMTTIINSRFAQGSTWKYILDIAVKIVPDFNRFNIKQYLLYKQNLPLKYLLNTTGYALSYMVVLLLITIILFRKRELL